jgi:hypothetical protein
LEPNWNDFCFEEGALWLALDQTERTLDAWKEALRRPTDDTLGLYRRMLEATRSRFELRDELRHWARENRAYMLLFLESSAALEFELESDQLLSQDPRLASLSSEERSHLFQMWSQRRRLADLAPLLMANPDWLTESWIYIARFHAELGDFQKACETVKRFATMPKVPLIDSTDSLAQLERDFYVKAKTLVNGLTLLHAQLKEEKLDDATATIAALRKSTTTPRYLSAIEFELEAKRGEWDRAWQAWMAFELAPH